ncbi:MAG: hypothetical protein ABR611_05340 [Chthoniobacterales bacterium]
MHDVFGGVLSVMRMIFSRCVASLIAMILLSGAALADKPVEKSSQDKKPTNERTVFVTGSLIPQRIKLKRIGTTTVSPVRIIDRREIDQSGRRTTQGALIVDPSVREIGR